MWDVINILHKHSEQCLHHMHHDYSTKEWGPLVSGSCSIDKQICINTCIPWISMDWISSKPFSSKILHYCTGSTFKNALSQTPHLEVPLSFELSWPSRQCFNFYVKWFNLVLILVGYKAGMHKPATLNAARRLQTATATFIISKWTTKHTLTKHQHQNITK